MPKRGSVSSTVRVAVAGLTITVLSTSAAWLAAHDFWIVPTGFDDDSAAVASTVTRFHAALAAGDSSGALALLTDDVVILESGAMETREEYRAHHLPADIAFARAVPSQRGPVRVVVRGDAAWATSTSTTTGEFRGRQVNSAGAELMVLRKEPGGWRIAAIHWSSRTRRPPS